MNDKTQARLRRARKSRVRMRTAGDVRLSVNRTPRHIYAQIINGDGDRVLAQASTLDKDLRSGATGNMEAAASVGKLVAERAKADWSFKQWQRIRDKATNALRAIFRRSWCR
jgi:large subunit ribosomal protein L18